MKRKPKVYFRKFGIELEFSTPLKEAQKSIKKIISKIYHKNKLIVSDVSSSSSTGYKKWELKFDGSTECELTTPISTPHSFKRITQVIDELSLGNLKLTNNDSVHIHMQADDVPKHNIIAAWILIEKTILKCFPTHRRDNGYCQKLVAKKYKKISDFFIDAEIEANAHHAIVSLNYYSQRKTVEFRMMEGNKNSNDILSWIKFCMTFLNYAKTIDPIEIVCDKEKPKLNIEELIQLLSIKDKEVINFLTRREARFKNQVSQ